MSTTPAASVNTSKSGGRRIGFDDLDPDHSFIALHETEYHGFIWTSFDIFDSRYFPSVGATSQYNYAQARLHGTSQPTISLRHGTFDLKSVELTGTVETQDVEFKGYRHDKLVYDRTVTVENTAPSLEILAVHRVERVEIISTHALIVDDIILSKGSGQHPHEPPTYQSLYEPSLVSHDLSVPNFVIA